MLTQESLPTLIPSPTPITLHTHMPLPTALVLGGASNLLVHFQRLRSGWDLPIAQLILSDTLPHRKILSQATEGGTKIPTP